MIRRIAFIASALLVLSCQVEQDYNLPARLDVFYAVIDDEAGSKVYVDDNLKVLWNKADEISVFNKFTYNSRFLFQGEDGANAGAFKSIDPDDVFVTGNDLPYVYAVYPYQESTSISNDGVLMVNLPSEQQYRADSFGLGANTMVAITSNNRFFFRNAGGYLAFKLYGSNVKVSSIALKGNNGEILAGNASITMPLDGVPSVNMQENGAEAVTLRCAQPITLSTDVDNPTEFWFVLPPVTFTKGFSITVTEADGGVTTLSTNTQVPILRNTRGRMSPVGLGTDQKGPIVIRFENGEMLDGEVIVIDLN